MAQAIVELLTGLARLVTDNTANTVTLETCSNAVWTAQWTLDITTGVFTHTKGLQQQDLAVPIRNVTGGALAAGDLVCITGWDETNKAFTVVEADADAAGLKAQLVMRGTLANNATGLGYFTYRLENVDTSGASAAGAKVYLYTTAGGWTVTAPTGATSIAQVVGYVAVKSATVGAIEFNLLTAPQLKVGTNELQAKSVTNTVLADIARGSVKVGGVGGAPTDLDAKGDGKILIGDGTDVKSVAMSGDVTITNAGATSIGAGKVTEAMLANPAADGLGAVRYARATYDFAVNGGAIGAIDSGVTIPDNAIILDGLVDVITTCTTEGEDAGTMAIHVEGADDIVAAVAVSDSANPWDAGLHDIKPVGTAATAVKTTAARKITFTIAGQAFTAGKLVVFLRYVVSD
jgi:hypothetical protein